MNIMACGVEPPMILYAEVLLIVTGLICLVRPQIFIQRMSKQTPVHLQLRNPKTVILNVRLQGAVLLAAGIALAVERKWK